MKKIILILIILITVITLTGCSGSNTLTSNKLQHDHCTRNATAGEGIDVSLSYELYYKGDVLKKLESTEQVKTEDSATLDEYENAYKGIHKNYEGLKYYDTKVKRTNNSVTSTIIINYEKIDIDKLIEIEGEEDNIFEDKVPKVDKWKELAKKIGTTCETVSK